MAYALNWIIFAYDHKIKFSDRSLVDESGSRVRRWIRSSDTDRLYSRLQLK